MTGILLPAMVVISGLSCSQIRRDAMARQCASNLTSVSFAARLYFNDHQDAFPRSILDLSNEVVNAKVLICPADAERQSPNHQAKISAKPWSLLTTNDVTYLLLGTGLPATNSAQHLFHCPIHQYSARADGRVFGSNGNKVPNGKFPNE